MISPRRTVAVALTALVALSVAAPWAASATAPSPAPTGLAVFRRGRRIDGACPSGPCIALTFDDGPDYVTTPRVLDELTRRGLRAAFFVVGRRIAGGSDVAVRNRAVLLDTHRRGHLVGNHTYDHANLDESTPEAIDREIDLGANLIRGAIGERTFLFRPPYGALQSPATAHAIYQRGYTPVLWELDSRDWAVHTAAAVLANVRRALDHAPNGGVLLMHDTLAHSVEALPAVLDEIAARSAARAARGEAPYRFATLAEFYRPLSRR